MGPSTVVGITEILERDRGGTIGLWLKPMTYAREIAGRTEERIVGKIAGWTVVKIGGKTGEKTGERIGG